MEELNYLAKRLESFDTGEAAQFQAMAHKLELFELKDLINLTFCCQQATVITDFSDLAAVGRDHYMNLHGGSASVDELNALVHVVVAADGGEVGKVGDARSLLAAEGQVDEILQLEQIPLVGHRLKLCGLAGVEAFQPLGEVVQLRHIDRKHLRALENSVEAVSYTHLDVYKRQFPAASSYS